MSELVRRLEIPIDRTVPFDIHTIELVHDKGWAVESNRDEDQRSLTVLIMDDVQLDKMPQDTFGGKTEIYLPFDARIFKAIWDNVRFIPRSWQGKKLVFSGTTLRHCQNSRSNSLALCWHGDEWHQGFHMHGDCV